ncbi:YqiA/YcfP family alpha/beta fold hydrolase [Aliikangiella sp. IMCC44653]
MNIWYLHGFRSTPNSNKVDLLRQYFPEHKVKGVDYEPHSPVNAAKTLSNELSRTAGQEEVILIGTSLGGFWSRWAAESFGERAIIINPSLNPDQSLPLGKFSVYGAAEQQISVTQSDLEHFKDYKVMESKGAECQVFLAMDDEVIDSNKTFTQLYHTYPVHTFPNGSHRFTQFEQLITQYLKPLFNL